MVGLVKESTNRPDFLRRTAWSSLASGIFAGLVAAWIWGWAAASGFVFAVFWGVANFAVLAAILKNATHPSGARVASLVGLMAIKLVGLYGLAVVVLLNRWFPVGAFAAGIGWPLATALLRSLTPSPLSRRAR